MRGDFKYSDGILGLFFFIVLPELLPELLGGGFHSSGRRVIWQSLRLRFKWPFFHQSWSSLISKLHRISHSSFTANGHFIIASSFPLCDKAYRIFTVADLSWVADANPNLLLRNEKLNNLYCMHIDWPNTWNSDNF